MIKLEKFDQAKKYLDRSLSLDGPSPEIYSCLGNVNFYLEDYSTSISFYQKSIKIDQMFKESYFGLGRSLSKLDKWFEAIHFFKKAYKIDNKNIEYVKSLAYAEFKVGNLVSI